LHRRIGVTRSERMRIQKLTEEFLLRLHDATTTSCNNCHVDVSAICRLRSFFFSSSLSRCWRQPIFRSEFTTINVGTEVLGGTWDVAKKRSAKMVFRWCESFSSQYLYDLKLHLFTVPLLSLELFEIEKWKSVV